MTAPKEDTEFAADALPLIAHAAGIVSIFAILAVVMWSAR